MDGYLKRESNLRAIYDRNSLDAPGTEDSSQSLSDWCQWGFIRPEKFEPSNIDSDRDPKPTKDEFIFDRATPSAEVIKGLLVHNVKGSSSKDNGELSFGYSSRIAADGQSKCQMQNSMNWMDELLEYNHNSLLWNLVLQEDNGNMQKTLQKFNMPDSISGSQSFENLLTDMITDAQSLKRDQSITEATDRDESACWQASSLMELEDILIHLNENMRVCFRDSLYRLANNSKDQHAINHHRSVNNTSFVEVNSGSPSLGGSHHGKSRTNVIDRTIANLIFNEHYFHVPAVSYSGY